MMKGHEMKTTETYTAARLCRMILPPMRWIAKDFMGEGIILLGGRPKGGKSTLAEQLGIAVATGGLFLGRYETVKGSVLYVNVDDPSMNGLQENLRLLGGDRVDGLTFMPDLPELDNGGLEILDQELARMAEIDPCRLLVLDTLTALRKEQAGKNLVKADYEFIASIRRLERKYGCTVLLIGHTRKDSTGSEKVDGIDAHLGTTGLTAAVDAVMLLTGADDTKKVLKAKGRRISPFEVHLELQTEDRSGWLVVEAPEEKKKELGALRQRILDAVRAIGPCGPDAVSKETGINLNTVRSDMRRMAAAGQLFKDSNACYSVEEHTPSILGVLGVLPVSPESPTSEISATDTPDTPDTPDSPPTQPVSPDPTGEVGEKYHTDTPDTGKTPNTPPTQPVSPMEPVLFRTKKGKIWKIGQDVACLSYELEFTEEEAESLLTYGQDAGQILAIVQNSWKLYSKANSRVAYLRDILAGGKKANTPAESTSKPLPMPAPVVEEPVVDLDAQLTAALRFPGDDDDDPFFAKAERARLKQEMAQDALIKAARATETMPAPARVEAMLSIGTTQPSIIDRLRAVIDSTDRGFNDIARLAGVSTRESSDALGELLERGEIVREEIDGLAYFSSRAAPVSILVIPPAKEASQWLN